MFFESETGLPGLPGRNSVPVELGRGPIPMPLGPSLISGRIRGRLMAPTSMSLVGFRWNFKSVAPGMLLTVGLPPAPGTAFDL